MPDQPAGNENYLFGLGKKAKGHADKANEKFPIYFGLALVVVFLITASLAPSISKKLGELARGKQGQQSFAQGKRSMKTIKTFFDEEGKVTAQEEKETEVGDKPQAFINGEKEEDFVGQSSPLVIDERPEKDSLKKYIVELSGKNLGEVNLDLEKKGLGRVQRTAEIRTRKSAISLEHKQAKSEIEKITGKKLKKGNPQKGERKLGHEFDTTLNGFAVELNPGEIEKVKQIKGIARVSEETTVKANLDTSVPMIQANSAWNLSGVNGAPLTGFGIKIGIIDTGIDYTHADLGGCFGPGCKVEGGYDFYFNDPDPMDDHGHGTHVAATAAGAGFAADGTQLYGIAPDAKIYAYKVLGPSGSGSSGGIIAALDRCVDPNKDGDFSDHLGVCSMSLGGSGNPDDGQSLASDNATKSGVIVTIAAGNSGPGYSTIGSPGTSRESITVGAACKSADVGINSKCQTQIANFSSRGPVKWVDRSGISQTMVKPDIVAPGVNICAAEWSTWLSGSRCHDSKHIAIAGTSMATPHVAGMAALLRQAAPNASTAEIKTAIKSAAAAYPNFDENTQGSGLVQVINALKILSPDLSFSSSLSSAPSFWVPDISLGSQTFTKTQAFTLRNTSASEITAAIRPKNVPAGLTFSFSSNSIVIPAGSSVKVDATLTGDVSRLISRETYLASFSVDSAIKNLEVTVVVRIPDRLKTPENVDFGIDPADTTGIWNSTKNISVTNYDNAAGTYSLTYDCCWGPEGKVSAGALLSAPGNSFSIGPGETSTFGLTLSLDNSLLSNGYYSGSVFITSPMQKTIIVPVRAVKGYVLHVNYPVTDIPDEVGVHNQDMASGIIYAGSQSSVTFVFGTKYPKLDVIGYFRDFGGPGNSEVYRKYVVYENLNFDGDDTVFLDPATATNEYKVVPTGLNGEHFDDKFPFVPFQAEELRFKKTAYPGISNSYSNFKPINFKFNNVSSNYVFSTVIQNTYGAESTQGVEKGLNLEYVLSGGINSSGTLTNKTSDLKQVPVFGNTPYGDDSLTFRNYSCQWSPGVRSCQNYLPSQMLKANNFRHDLYMLPVTGADSYAKAVLFQRPYLERSGSSLTDAVSLILGENGLLRWRNSSWINTAQPLDYINSDNRYRMDLGILPDSFDINWSFYNSGFTIGKRNQFACLFIGQDGDHLAAQTMKFRVSKDGVLNGEGALDYCSTHDITPFVNNQSGNYEVELYSTNKVNGADVNESYKAAFVLPVSFNSAIHDVRPPTTAGFHFLSGGIPAQVADPSKEQTLTFSLDPSPRLGGTDSISSVTVRVKEGSGQYKVINVSKDVSTGVYTATAANLADAPIYTFEIMAKDNSNNILTYSFELPKGVVPSVGGAVSSPSPIPAATPSPSLLPSPSISPDPSAAPSPSTNPTPGPSALPSPSPSPVPGDKIAPTVSITSPANGAVVPRASTVTISATATDDVGVARVEFYVSGRLTCSDAAAPYTCSWKVPNKPNASYTIEARAYDTTGNWSYSRVTVKTAK